MLLKDALTGLNLVSLSILSRRDGLLAAWLIEEELERRISQDSSHEIKQHPEKINNPVSD